MTHLATTRRSPARAVRALVHTVALGCVLTCVSPTMSVGKTIRGDPMNEIKCTIEKMPTSFGYNLRGVVWSETGGTGSYRLSVTKQGASGRSSTIQEGLFALKKGERQMLSTVSIGAGPGDYINATLKIKSNDQELCTAEL